jgi:hypothetical protein
LFFGLISEFFDVFGFVVGSGSFSKNVADDAVRVMFRVDFRLFEFFVVVLFDLLVKSFFDFLLDSIFFILLVSDPVIFEHSFFHSGLIDQLVFEFHVLVFLLF